LGVLDGIRVLEFTHFISGPLCCQTLADHGAEVIKIEPPDGELSRRSLPFYEGQSLYFASLNRNKRSVKLDLKSELGRRAVERLVKTADVIVINYAPGVPERLGIDYETVSKINPRIVMVHITGFGNTGPHKYGTAFDGIIQARSGIAHLTGEKDGPPTMVGLYIADHIAGFQGVIGTLMALKAREQTGKGQFVDISMLDSMVTLLAYHFAEVQLLGVKPFRKGSRFNNNFGGMFATKDGHIIVSPTTEKLWDNFCKALDKPEWTEPDSPYITREGRIEHAAELERLVLDIFKERTTDELVALFEKAGVPCGPVRSVEELLEDPQLIARGALKPVPLSDTSHMIAPGVPIKIAGWEEAPATRPPRLGEHTAEVLAELDFSESEIREFLSI